MARLLPLSFILVLTLTNGYSQTDNKVKHLPEICVSPTENELYKRINEYRVQKGLPEIKLSASLCFVAQTHAKDQAENFKDGSRCNLHSWSDKGKWSSCCYTPDHKKAECMWNKPRELTTYRSDGFEISFFSTYNYSSPTTFATDILDGWKKSPGHNDVIVNKNTWKDMKWKAIGIGVYGDYTDVWFGLEEDNTWAPLFCD